MSYLIKGKILAFLFYMVLALVLSGQSMASSPAPKETIGKFEIRFMEGMIDHHAMAVHMSQMCVKKDIQDELKSLCNSIATSQQQEIKLMQGWLNDWYDIQHEPEMSKSDSKQMEKLDSLNGAEFEIRFMKNMIKHHWQAVIEGAQCMERAYHDELETLCENIILTQATEIKQMRTWLCEWHNICGSRPENNNHENS